MVSWIIWFIATYWLTIVSIIGAIALTALAIVRRDDIADFFERFNESIQTSCYQTFERYSEWRWEQQFTDKAILKSSKKRAHKLMALIPGIEWMDIRTQISEITFKHIPQLLIERKQIKNAIQSAQNVLDGVTTIPQQFITDLEKQQNKRTTESIQELVGKGNQNNVDINDCVSILNHVEVDLHKAMLSETDREALRTKLRTLTSRIEENKKEIKTAQGEVTAFVQQGGIVLPLQAHFENSDEDDTPRQQEPQRE